MTKGRRAISPEDRALFWQALQSGVSTKEAARIAGISYNAAVKWVAKAKSTKATIELENITLAKPDGGRGKVEKDRVEMVNMPPVIPAGRLSERAQKGLDDFDFFRRVYLGRVPSPWQVDAAYKIVEMLEHHR
jgi:transposase-like protein